MPSAPPLADRVVLLTADALPPRVREETTAVWEAIALLALGIADWDHELFPVGDSTVVFRDSAFADKMAKTHFAVILEQYGLTHVRSL